MAVLHICPLLQDSCCNNKWREASLPALTFWDLKFLSDLFIYLFIFREIPLHMLKDSTKTLFSFLHASSGEVVVIPGIKDVA